jgi:hypothetical protein
VHHDTIITRYKHDTTHIIIEQTNTTHHCPPIRNDLLLLLPVAAGMAVHRRQAVRDGQEGREKGTGKYNKIAVNM